MSCILYVHIQMYICIRIRIYVWRNMVCIEFQKVLSIMYIYTYVSINIRIFKCIWEAMVYIRCRKSDLAYIYTYSHMDVCTYVYLCI